MEQWDVAQKALDSLPVEERTAPKMKYLRARVALSLGQPAEALTLLEGLGDELPVLSEEVNRAWAEAASQVGPYGKAAEHFAKSRASNDLVLAALALEKGAVEKDGDKKAARKMADRAITASERAKNKSGEAKARGARARLALAEKQQAVAVVDLMWLAEKVPASEVGSFARAKLRELNKPLKGKRMLACLDALIAAGRADEAVNEMELLSGVSKAETLHARAWVTYRARDYEKAAKLWMDASKVRSGRTAEQLYYRARSLARSGSDDEAIKAHGDVVRRFQKGLWAERAGFQKARLLMLNGRYAEAVKAYTSFVSKFPKSSDVKAARYDMALSRLSSGDAKTARKAFAAIANKAPKRDVGIYRQLEGVAALRAGARDDAIVIWKNVIAEQPLTWGAMMSRARLKSIDVEPPEVMLPAGKASSFPLTLKLPPKVSLLLSLGLDLDAEAELSRMEQAAAEPYVGRESEALCGMYAQMSTARRRYRVGTKAVSFEALMRTPTASERWGWDCVYPRPYAATVNALSTTHKVPDGLAHAVMRQESAFKPKVKSYVGAAGLMQLMPKTAAAAATEGNIPYAPSAIHSPPTNIGLGTFYLGKLLRTFEGSEVLAVASYNAGPTAVSHWLSVGKDQDADLWVARIPYRETRKYVSRVMTNFVRYQWLAGGNDAVSELALALPVHARAKPEDY